MNNETHIPLSPVQKARNAAKARAAAAPVDAWLAEVVEFVCLAIVADDRALAFNALREMVRASLFVREGASVERFEAFAVAAERAAAIATPEDAAEMVLWSADQKARACLVLASHAADWESATQGSDMREARKYLRKGR